MQPLNSVLGIITIDVMLPSLAGCLQQVCAKTFVLGLGSEQTCKRSFGVGLHLWVTLRGACIWCLSHYNTSAYPSPFNAAHKVVRWSVLKTSWGPSLLSFAFGTPTVASPPLAWQNGNLQMQRCLLRVQEHFVVVWYLRPNKKDNNHYIRKYNT